MLRASRATDASGRSGSARGVEIGVGAMPVGGAGREAIAGLGDSAKMQRCGAALRKGTR